MPLRWSSMRSAFSPFFIFSLAQSHASFAALRIRFWSAFDRPSKNGLIDEHPTVLDHVIGHDQVRLHLVELEGSNLRHITFGRIGFTRLQSRVELRKLQGDWFSTYFFPYRNPRRYSGQSKFQTIGVGWSIDRFL